MMMPCMRIFSTSRSMRWIHPNARATLLSAAPPVAWRQRRERDELHRKHLAQQHELHRRMQIAHPQVVYALPPAWSMLGFVWPMLGIMA
jgi:hypothetical protein